VLAGQNQVPTVNAQNRHGVIQISSS